MPEWSPLMGIGIEEIDRGHRELVEKLNELGLAMKRGRGREVLGDLLAFVRSHAESHFAVEEGLMARSGYPRYEEHRKRHDEFRAELAARLEAFAGDPSGPELVTEIHGWMMHWLSHHEIAADAPLADHLRERGLAPP